MKLMDSQLRFNYLATNSVSVLDYDKNKDYRFLIAGNDNKIHNYNVLGKGVSGWIYPMDKFQYK